MAGTDSQSPTVDLSADKRELFELLIAEEGEDFDTFPLSFSQERLWFLTQLEPGSPFYNISSATRITGTLDARALERSLGEVVARHETLRTTFPSIGGHVVQLVRPPAPVTIPVVELGGADEGAREAEARALVGAEAHQPFNLAQGPLLRAKLLRLSDTHHILLLTMHHIISDGWSVGVLIQEMVTLYSAFTRGEESPLAELPIQYADYAAWQREWLSGEALDAQLAYWRERLAGAPPVLELPTDRPRPALQSYRGSRVSFDLDPELARGLRELARGEGATLFMVLLAAFDALLYRYTNQTDILVGTPVAGRTRAETERLIGCFVNTLVVRAEVRGGEPFRELLRRVREACLGAYAHQEVPFERVVEEVGPERSLSHAPLFQVMFAFNNTPRTAARAEGLSIEAVEAENATAQFDLSLVASETGGGIAARLEYNTDLFDEATAGRMAGHFRRLLEAVVAEPTERVGQLPLLGEDEERRLLLDWNRTRAEYPRDACLHQLFEAQAERTPDAPAILLEEERVTYSELNRRANRLAHHLRSLGVGPEVFVAVMLNRSVEMVVGMLAALKAGGAYVPIDPDYPAGRVLRMLSDSRARVLLTEESLLASAPRGDWRVVCLDRDREAFAGRGGENPGPVSTADNLAYVIYTSGSTGLPKGVAIQHRSLVNYLAGAGADYSIGGDDRFLQFASASFDTSAEEVFLTLTRGATLVLRTKSMSDSVAEFVRRCEEWKVTAMSLPTAFWHELAMSPEVEGLPGTVRLVIIGGEKALAGPLASWRRYVGPRVRLVNTYGPSEATVVTTKEELTGAADDDEAGDIPIGRPVENLRAYVLSQNFRPAPVGVVGELHVGGDGLARGYLNRPALTAERFVPDPFSGEPGARLYRTGDLARYLDDGRLAYTGRRDGQVKVRGFRVEVGEIEAALLGHASVRECAVAARASAGGARLVAYVVGEGVADFEALREHLRERLPAYMVPSQFVGLERLPLTPNGKVDRKALPEPGPAGDAGGKYEPPVGAVEEVLAGVWAEVLGAARVGRGEDFFELGGHSLLATRLLSRVRSALGVELPLRQLFETPTVAGLAAAAERQLRAGAAPALPPIERAPRDGPLSFAQQRLWFLGQLEPAAAAYHLPSAVRLSGRLDVTALEGALGEVVRRHESLRTTFPSDDGRPVQLIHPPAPVTLDAVDLSQLPVEARESEARRLTVEEAQRPFDLAAGPLFRSSLVKLSDDEHILLLTTHHIVSDGWSIGVLVGELSTLYAALSRGEASPLPELPVQYADYAAWQRRYLTDELLGEELAYWRGRLAGAPPVLELPTDRPRPAVQSYRGARFRFALSREFSRGLRKFARAEGATTFMVLLAAFKTLLYRYTNQSDLLVGTPVAGRTRSETERLIGCFVNTLVLRTRVEGGESFGGLLARVREACLGAYAHQEVPFERVVEEVGPERSLSHAPLFQVMFAFNNTPRGAAALPGLRMEPVEADGGTTKFDLSLSLVETGEELGGAFEYSTDLFDSGTVARLSGHYIRLLEAAITDPGRRVGELPLLGEEEVRQFEQWNETAADYPRLCVHELIEEQAQRTPDAVAVEFEGERLTYAELDARANQLARHLRGLGVGPESLVAVMLERSTELVVSLLAVWKAGGAYVPLDPEYPAERLRFMLEDSRAHVLVTESGLASSVPEHGARVVFLDTERDEIALHGADTLPGGAAADNLAYVIYTSGSTGRPKGVMVAHRNVVNFIAGMDERLQGEPPGTWLALTSTAFDISVLELFWTLARGFRVVVQSDRAEALYPSQQSGAKGAKAMDFSLFYFASDESEGGGDKYRLLIEGAKFADRHGFTAVWTPERHFHAFGGLYPNPSVTSAAIAAVTERVGIRAGSVVMPLHHPLRVAEEWAVVDNISRGRVAISFASGWHADDFVIAPESFAERKQIMLREIETVRRLWRGEPASFRGGAGNDVEVRIFPKPVQTELPVWLTAAGNPETFEMAAEIGANLLTHLLGQSLEELTAKVGLYRKGWREAGRAGEGRVTLMLHTFVGESLEEVRERVRVPFTNYLRSSVDLTRNMARSLGRDIDPKKLTEEDMEAVLAHAFDRFFETSGLFGTPESCLAKVAELRRAGVDEVACLIDFGVEVEAVMRSLELLDEVRRADAEAREGRERYTLPAQIAGRGVTHVQFTPSTARMLLLDEQSAEALGTVREILVGGEALPAPLARQLREVAPARLHNMYGPTETTVWSSTHAVEEVGAGVPVGRPVANTEIHVVDKLMRRVPVGVAGELLIGGEGVARGYLARAVLTAERFVPNPFSREPGARLYRTGDLARYLPDGQLDFLGRADQQVKLGGHRIEVGEIENALVGHDWVREAVVVAREDEAGGKRLVAYVVVEGKPAEEAFEQQLVGAASAELPVGERRYRLPNGMVIAHLSDFQTNLGYREIFENEAYLKHGITLRDGACVFDVGANTGFFSLFVNRKCRGAKIYAFEPIPTTFEILRTNAGLHRLDAKLFNCGISDRAGSATFTFYPLMDGLSSRYADTEKDKQVTRTIILDWLRQHPSAGGPELLTPEELDQVLGERFRAETFDCPLRTLSDVFAEEGVAEIDLLKVDVERSELDVLRGVRDEDWKKIKQVVMEVESDELLADITALLEGHDFEVKSERIINVEGSAGALAVHIYMLYAVQRGYRPAPGSGSNGHAPAPPPAAAEPAREWSLGGVRAYLRERLPGYMLPSAYVLLDALPLTPNGKVDRKALPDPQGLRPELEVEYVEPRNETERLITSVWQEVLGVERVGVHDNFFEVGGTSLLIAQVYSRLRDECSERLTMVEMFRHPTIASLARFLSGEEEAAGQPTVRQAQERVRKQAGAVLQQQKLMAERRQAAARRKPRPGP